MAKKYTAGNLKCSKCNLNAQGSMYRHKGQKVCRDCANKILGRVPDEVH